MACWSYSAAALILIGNGQQILLVLRIQGLGARGLLGVVLAVGRHRSGGAGVLCDFLRHGERIFVHECKKKLIYIWS